MDQSTQAKPYTDLSTEAAVEAIMREGGGSAVIDFWAGWCGPCRAMAPAFEAVARQYAEEPVGFYKIDTETHPNLSRAFNIRSLPTLLFIHDGEILEAHIGTIDARRLGERVDTLLSKARGEGFLHRLMGRHKRK